MISLRCFLKLATSGQVIKALDSDGLEYWVYNIYNNYHHLTQRLYKITNRCTLFPNFPTINILPKKRKLNIFFKAIYKGNKATRQQGNKATRQRGNGCFPFL